MSSGGGGAAQGAMQTALTNQGTAATGIGNNINTLNQQAGMLNAPTAATSGAITNNVNAAAPGMAQGLGTALNSQGNMSGQTGVNQNQLGQQFVNYASNTGATNLSQANQGLQGFYGNEMTQGMGSGQMLNAQNQLQQQFAQANATSQNQAGPGTNQAATQQANQNALLTASGNLAGSLAGQNQTIKQQGATGVASTASNLDTQTMNMLQQALTGGEGLNTQTLQNLMSALGLGTTAINQGLDSSKQGLSATDSAGSLGGGLFTGYGTQAQQFGSQAAQNQQNSGLGGFMKDVGGLVSGIGSAGKAASAGG